jgi:nucleoside-diphosphate-sugar epimerase
MARHLVTGGSGYFGEVLVKKLLEQGNNVRIFDLNLPSFSHSNLEVIQGNIVDLKSVVDVCNNIDVVYHCIAQVPLAKNRELFWKVNQGGMKNLLQAAQQNKIPKVIYVSSSAVYGVPEKLPVTEQDPPNPQEAYGNAKYAAELLCQEYIQEGLDISIIRPRTILGHGRLGIFQILFEWIYQNYNIPVLGKGNNIYQFVHAEDLADACIAAGVLVGADIFNIGAVEYGSMEEVLQNLINNVKSSSKIRYLPFKIASFLMSLTSLLKISPLGAYHTLMYGRSMYFDLSHAKEKLNFQPKYSNDSMFKESYQWYVDHRQEVLSNSGNRSKHQSAVKQGILALVRIVL